MKIPPGAGCIDRLVGLHDGVSEPSPYPDGTILCGELRSFAPSADSAHGGTVARPTV
jgi:hypothetical protein